MSALSVNVGRSERWASVLGGAGLILNGLVRPSMVNTLLALGGVGLIQRGVSGHCPVYDFFGETPSPERRYTYGTGKRGNRPAMADDDHIAALSFPASDPPAWTGATVGHPLTTA